MRGPLPLLAVAVALVLRRKIGNNVLTLHND